MIYLHLLWSLCLWFLPLHFSDRLSCSTCSLIITVLTRVYVTLKLPMYTLKYTYFKLHCHIRWVIKHIRPSRLKRIMTKWQKRLCCMNCLELAVCKINHSYLPTVLFCFSCLIPKDVHNNGVQIRGVLLQFLHLFFFSVKEQSIYPFLINVFIFKIVVGYFI